jgi:outer membrane protein W
LARSNPHQCDRLRTPKVTPEEEKNRVVQFTLLKRCRGNSVSDVMVALDVIGSGGPSIDEEIFMRYIQAIAVVALGAALLSPASAQTAGGSVGDAEVVHLAGRHAIVVSVGVMGHTANVVSVTGGGVGVSVDSRGVFWIGYGHWFQPDWALLAETGMVASKVAVSGSGTETAAVFPLLFGVQYQPEGWALGETVRPYLGVSAGSYFGLQTETGWSVNVGTQTAVGARLSAGLDVIPGRHISIGAAVRYHAVTDFDRPVGSRDNYSGFEFSVRLGILLGKGR